MKRCRNRKKAKGKYEEMEKDAAAGPVTKEQGRLQDNITRKSNITS